MPINCSFLRSTGPSLAGKHLSVFHAFRFSAYFFYHKASIVCALSSALLKPCLRSSPRLALYP